METRYVIEVKNHLNNMTKNAYIDHKEGSIGFEARGSVALRIQSTLPISVSHKEKDYIVDSIKNGFYRELEDGARSLPEVITRLGGMTLPKRQVDFSVKIYRVKSDHGISDISVDMIESFSVTGIEGKGKANRHKTQFQITDTVNSVDLIGSEFKCVVPNVPKVA